MVSTVEDDIDRIGRFDSGLVQRINDDYKVTDLPDTVGVNPSLLNAPIYVLHPTAARKLDAIEIDWTQTVNGTVIQKSFRFLRSASTPFPTVTHAKYLDILLSMFSQNWNPEGILHFRYSDIQRIAGKATSSRARESIQQTILRYHRHTTEWENCWNGRSDRLTFNIIERSSIVDDRGNIKKHSPGRSKTKDKWHTVVFHREIVKALKDEKKRILLTDLFHRLDHDTFCVYRYYYGYPESYLDRKGDRQPNIIWRNVEFLKNIFKWTGQKNRFLPWFTQRIEELEALGLIDPPVWNNDAVGIHCKNLKEINAKTVVELVSEHDKPENLVLDDGHIVDMEFDFAEGVADSLRRSGLKSRRQGASKKPPMMDLSKISNEAILVEYRARKDRNLIEDEHIRPIELLLESNMVDAAINLIKAQVLS